MKIKELPETERPYEKMELYGEKSLSDAELLAIIIKTRKYETSVELAQRILKLNDTREDSLKYLQQLTIEELMKIKGIGKVKALQLKALCELTIRMTKPSNYKKIVIKKPEDLAKVLMPEMKFLKNEVVKVVMLNNKNQIFKIEEVSKGGNNFANVSIRNILGQTLKAEVPKIIIVHNHPSGDATPSNQDLIFTEKILELFSEFNIEVLDHLVIGDMTYTSIMSELVKNKRL